MGTRACPRRLGDPAHGACRQQRQEVHAKWAAKCSSALTRCQQAAKVDGWLLAALKVSRNLSSPVK